MNSYDVQDHGATVPGEQGKKPWVTPALQVIPLRSAEAGGHLSTHDGTGAKFQQRFS
jgi:hypothetical protein